MAVETVQCFLLLFCSLISNAEFFNHFISGQEINTVPLCWNLANECDPFESLLFHSNLF